MTTPTLREALSALLDRYTGLVNCGDCGNWDPETEPVVIDARAALAQPVPDATLCHCKDRLASACPGEWEPGCDLGNNPAHVRVAHPQPAPPEDWFVYNTGACVADGLTWAEAHDYLTPARLQRGWNAVCVATRDNIVDGIVPAPTTDQSHPQR